MVNAPGIINDYLPKKNKYTNFKNIETIVFSEMSSLQIQRLVNLIKTNYLQNKDNIFSPQSENIVPYLTNHNDKSFVSLYNEEYHMTDLKKGTMITDKKVIGAMTSRPVNIIINNNKNTNTNEANFKAYYVDYLCVDKLHRKKGIAPQLIQTHHYNQSHINKNINVSLFKREDELTGIVPLCVYSTYGFSVNRWTKPQQLLQMYSILEVNSQNMHLLIDFIKINKSVFDIIINTEIANIIELIKTKNIYIFVIMFDNSIICAYFFRKSCVFIEKDKEVLSCFASINNCDNNDIFIQGFKICFWKIADENNFGFSAVENISHNNIIIENLITKTNPMIVSPTAYFFYNFAYNSFKSERTFIIA